MDILDSYIRVAPSRQAVLDIFDGEWSSAMPGDSSLVTRPGTAALFEDARITTADAVLGPFKGLKILELGPLEAGHSYMCQALGAESVVSIESNSRAFLKCLCIQNVFNLDRVTFRYGDFNEYLRKEKPKFDVALASGVLYHMIEPLQTLQLLSDASDRLFLWTHYYDEAIVQAAPQVKKLFTATNVAHFMGRSYQLHKREYQEALNWKGFCGGSTAFAHWLTRDGLLDALTALGYAKLDISFDAPDHPNGPALAICARR
jgi:hypothetical protein